ncbi:MAG TPA: dipeptide/oligopeptide/nickel ABC transporter permease/ATP-binding protein [Rhodoglobus sp.]|nr:dipeptide/oligopeptide/nickel ABC transporter permease/ATP-binding protein [Rhodoglobus sp.]HPM50662.1 dipeptide/oligopeptide/nickel ABC transporter permease/ATP-binding protein [Rhodoglobus sp.]HQA22254.1 dipeptide/oligopeptide/nickel ABC transporter permease/ATP-binding protein [Rhodoglobus sp.]HQG69544.1 dipeptide/oligopeptide/nickel ABC transporter permease/ATP-binding protein [Rhodoglobus sp.]HQI64945.1 dipeptide/oligopeptide/nickel ABC transporter permease/ATP-binding protein [Rhodoglo
MSVELGLSATAEPGTFVRQGMVRRLIKKPTVIIAVVILATALFVALFGRLLAPFDPNYSVLDMINMPPFQSDFILGGDRAGRDILSRLMYATANSLGGAAIAVVVSTLLGVTSGLLAGYYSGAIDAIGAWVSNVIQALPGIIVLIAVYVVAGPSTVVSMTVVGILFAPAYFRLVRNVVISVRNELYVDAAKVAGLSDARIIGRHVLVVVRAPIIIEMAFVAGFALVIQAGLEFIGLGSPENPTWGGMLQDSFNALYISPLSILWPAAAIILTVLAFVLISNAVRDTLGDPRNSAGRKRRAIQGDVESQAATSDAFLSVNNLSIAYPLSAHETREVVKGVSLEVNRGEVLGLVGESGSGKTQTAFAILGLLPEEAIVASGRITLGGRSLLGLSEKQLNALRGNDIAYVPQEPMTNLDPAFTVGQQFDFAMRKKLKLTKAQTKERAIALLARVNINDPERVHGLYPHQLSGGMAQRVLIAIAVSCDPALLIADEPTTALDVTVQAEVLDLLRDLQRERSMAMILVTHNFGVVADICDRVAVMKDGRVVETGDTRSIIREPQDPYTQLLLASVLDNAPMRAPLDAEKETAS